MLQKNITAAVKLFLVPVTKKFHNFQLASWASPFHFPPPPTQDSGFYLHFSVPCTRTYIVFYSFLAPQTSPSAVSSAMHSLRFQVDSTTSHRSRRSGVHNSLNIIPQRLPLSESSFMSIHVFLLNFTAS
jgi:hypothetical protein